MTGEKHNAVTKPSHYQFANACYEVRDVIRDRTEGVYIWWGPWAVYDYINAIKYLLRAPYKNKRQDLLKAKYCIETLLEITEEFDYNDEQV